MNAIVHLAETVQQCRIAAEHLTEAIAYCRKVMFTPGDYSDLVETLAETRGACDELLDAEKALDVLIRNIERELAARDARADY